MRLTARDLWLLEAIAKMRFLRTADVARLGFGGSRWAAQKRLRKLFDRGLLRVWVPSLNDENVYGVTTAGIRAMADDRPDLLQTRVPRGLDRNLKHLLGINRARIAFVLGTPRLGGTLLWWRSDWQLRPTERAVVPDAIFAVRWPEAAERLFALEFDHASRSQRGFLRKLLGYEALRGRTRSLIGNERLHVLVVGSAVWIGRYRERMRSLPISKDVWFTTLDALESQLDAPIWQRPETDEIQRLDEIGR